MEAKVLIVAPSPDVPGQWIYKTYADGDKRHYGGTSPEACVMQAYERCLIDEKDHVHLSTAGGIEVRTVKSFVNP